MDDIFRTLAGSSRFDKKRYKSRAGQHSGRNANKVADDDAHDHEDATLPPTLDFFQEAQPPKKKQRLKSPQDASKSNAKTQLTSAKDEKLSHHHKESMSALRHAKKIRLDGNDISDPVQSFADLEALGCDASMLRAVSKAGLTQPTPIQMQAIPAMLSGREVIGCAPTGSGKTLAFILPVLAHAKARSSSQPSARGIGAVVIAPTLELSQQIYREFALLIPRGSPLKVVLLTKATAVGSLSSMPRIDVLVGTPLRILSLVEPEDKQEDQSGGEDGGGSVGTSVTRTTQHTVSLSTVERLVLDEADRLFELGFLDQLDAIMSACVHPQLISWMFSATMPPPIEELARIVTKDPIRVIIGHRNATVQEVTQRLVFVGQEDGKLHALRQLLREGVKMPLLVFVQAKDRAEELYRELTVDRVNVGVVHADRSKFENRWHMAYPPLHPTQAQRESVVKDFRAGNIWVLVATDVFARGMDFRGVNCVVNYDFPQSAVSYIHRIGRTGRAGRVGEAITFFTESDVELLRPIANIMREAGCEVPPWMLELKKLPKDTRRQMERRPVARKPIAQRKRHTFFNPPSALNPREKDASDSSGRRGRGARKGKGRGRGRGRGRRVH